MKKIVPLMVLPLALAACSSDSRSQSSTTAAQTTSTSTTTHVDITVTVGTDSGIDRIENVKLGSEVTLKITNPSAADEFHLHGYDLSAGETPRGEVATITFTANKAGEFEVESHVTEEVMLVLVVK